MRWIATIAAVCLTPAIPPAMAVAAAAPLPAWAAPAVEPAAAPRSDLDLALAALRALEGGEDVASGLQVFVEADEAERRIRDWPAGAPARATVRGCIDFGLAIFALNKAWQANSPLYADMSNTVDRLLAAGDRIDSTVSRNASRRALLISTQMIGYMLPLLDALDTTKATAIRHRLRAMLGMMIEQGDFAAADKASLLMSRGLTYTDAEIVGDDAAFRASVEDFSQARAIRLRGGDQTAARAATVAAIERAMAFDPGGRKAAAILAQAAAEGPPGWLDRRSLLMHRARIAEAAGDLGGAVALSERWYRALHADIAATTGSVFDTSLNNLAQLMYLELPLKAGDVREALRRADALDALTGTVPPTPKDVPVPERADGAGPAEIARPLDRARLGVDLVVIASTTSKLASADIQRLVRDGPRAVGVAGRISWGAIAADGTQRVAASELSALAAIAEGARGLRSLGPALVTMIDSSGFTPAWQARQSQMIDRLAPLIAESEAAFFVAFGRPLLALVGAQCRAPRRGARRPTVLLILPTAMSFYPIEVARAPNGARLIDCLEIRRAPSPAAAARSADRWAAGGLAAEAAGIWNPQGDLVHADVQRSTLVSLLGTSHVRAIAVPDTEAMTTWLTSANGIVHIAAHGRVGMLDPPTTAIAATPTRWLTLADLRAVRDTAPGPLVVLSACEGALSSPLAGEIANASIGAAFLGAGARGVVATLWQVRDDAAALVVARFYDLLLRERRPPAEALQAAQRWLRDSPADALVRFAQATARNGSAADRDRVIDLAAAIEQQAAAAGRRAPYADSLLWGGFAYLGTYPRSAM